MAENWIKLRVDLWDHPKVVRLLSAICPDSVRDTSAKCRVIGAMYRTWSIADKHSVDGVLDGYTADALDADVGISGWSLSLQHVGWLVVEPQRLVVPRFGDHNGESAKRRAEDAKRKRTARKSSELCPQGVRENADVLRTRIDKIREDKNKEREREETQENEYSLSVGKAEALKNLLDGNLIPEKWLGQDTIAALDQYVRWIQTRDGRPIDCIALRTRLSKIGDWSADRLRRSLDLTISMLRTDKIFDADSKAPKKGNPVVDRPFKPLPGLPVSK